MIELYHVNKDYGRAHHALVDVSLAVEKGEFVFLTGSSGAGKTTLLRLLFREEIATSGKILVDGINVSTLPASKVPGLRRRLGIVFQDFKLLPRRTVFENVALVMEITGASRKVQRSRTYAVLEMLGLNHKVRAHPLELSGGEQQRVAIARALVSEPVLLLADEPTGNLDPDLSWEIMTLFKSINIRGTTVLVATHDRDLIARMGKRVIALDAGRLASA
ncbi:MAG TPA: cell division ATP-binding protein FtsE [Candidatus Polarisedimenticolia bacterium]|nr:cell division ATP-binding protein FtsE [Candidatus Polarisedimenticolia bacterium]